MVLKNFDESSKLHELEFHRTWFCVQVHDIPIHFLLKQAAEQICEIVGDVRRSPKSTDDDGGNFIRVRVLVDINLPLCRGRLITVENSEKFWVRFQYERLPKLCYWCGRLTHNDKRL